MSSSEEYSYWNLLDGVFAGLISFFLTCIEFDEKLLNNSNARIINSKIPASIHEIAKI